MNFNLCSTIGANTGPIDCDRKKGLPVKFLVGSAAFAANQWDSSADFYTALQASIHQAAGSSGKLFPFPTIQGNTDTSEQNTTGNLGYGLKFILREGRPSYTFQVLCGETQYKALRKFNNTIAPVFVLDEEATWGIKDLAGNFVGYKALIFVSGNGFEDGSSAEKKAVKIDISFVSAAEFNDGSFYFINSSFTEADLNGMVDFPVGLNSAVSGTTKFTLRALTAQLGVNVDIADYPALVTALTVSLWKAYTGAALTTPLTLTSMTFNAATKDWSIVFDATMYGALASGAKIKVKLDDPAALFAAGITGVESISIIIAKP